MVLQSFQRRALSQGICKTLGIVVSFGILVGKSCFIWNSNYLANDIAHERALNSKFIFILNVHFNN